MTRTAHILVVDDERNVRRVLEAQLTQAGYGVTTAESGVRALKLIADLDPELVLTDLRMPGLDGMELLGQIRRDFPEIPVVLLTAHGTIETAVEAMKRGAFDFLSKPFDKDMVLEVIGKAIRQARRARSEFQGPPAAGTRCGLVGSSAAMAAVCERIERVAPSDATVLVTGETGTGKELVAEAIHRLSSRREGPLVRINCGALPESLVESELFGHERGAFTGADRARPGRFELADGGTLFLDEVGELPLGAQVKLLRVLEDGRVDRLGGEDPVRVDVRLVVATNRVLETEVERGRFREDLLFRLRVIEIPLPPLRERREDIPELVEFFVEKTSGRLDVPRRTIGDEARAVLMARRWPGNVRELEHAIERALLLTEGESVPAETFAEPEPASPEAGSASAEGNALRHGATGGAAGDAAGGGVDDPGNRGIGRVSGNAELDIKRAARAAAAAVERRMIREALDATSGNVTHAAERLGLSRRGLQLKLRELGID